MLIMDSVGGGAEIKIAIAAEPTMCRVERSKDNSRSFGPRSVHVLGELKTSLHGHESERVGVVDSTKISKIAFVALVEMWFPGVNGGSRGLAPTGAGKHN